MLVNIGCFQLAFHPNDVSNWKTNIFRLGTLCAIMKSVEGFGLLFDITFILVSSYFGFLNHVLILALDIIWKILLIFTLVSDLLV